ncbi:putative RNA methyltransferase YsgA [Candidatus Syntrophocurvum alkaliphilum]|uniref:Putative RNA methyltransferase YsgA n=1 Tax=Candidatus Syntrophocurvum alkaliphilum TaxID=2293317 RepID=A0A6I6DF25_9FIRM|nr:RNA methyltransferase [Candidatus Syntrophocurvum alkaliphilum]QGT99717.1 putative RNA methyltransferase YsgA [Candidatus Syntrophocurvum alkaliphilum]
MKVITSKDNKEIKLAYKLRNKKTRQQENAFFIEGKKIVEEALKETKLTKKVFLMDDLVDEFRDYILENPQIDWYNIDTNLLNHICTTETPQGIAAIVQKPECSLIDVIEANNIFLLLDQIADPGNLGSIIRTAWAMKVDGVLLTPGNVDPFSPKVVRSTMGGIFKIPVFTNIGIQHLRLLKDKGYTIACTDLRTENDFYNVDFNQSMVVVMGSEASGVSREVKDECQLYFKIPIDEQVDSLNVAIACGIIISETFRQRRNS